MELERELKQWGNSVALVIPPDMLKELKLSVGSKIKLDIFEKKHGKFGAFWPENQKG